jgi:hypothetical protein
MGYLKYFLVFYTALTTIIVNIRRGWSSELISAASIFIFTILMLTAGSLDRQNMAMLSIIFSLGLGGLYGAKPLAGTFILASILTMPTFLIIQSIDMESFDSAFSVVFSASFILMLTKMAFYERI